MRSAAAQMAHMSQSQPQHPCDLGDGFLFHRRTGPPSIQRVVVRIYPHCQRIGEPCHGVRAA